LWSRCNCLSGGVVGRQLLGGRRSVLGGGPSNLGEGGVASQSSESNELKLASHFHNDSFNRGYR
jgi:hypothetical protein